MATENKTVISPFIYYSGWLLQPQDGQNMSDFIIYSNIFGDFEEWHAQEKERSDKRWSRSGRGA